MNITFQKAKNNEDIITVNNLYLHSNYNPSKEAERFIDNLNFQFTPQIIILLEPGLSYSVSFLRKKFPECKIGVIRYIEELNKYNKDYDFAISFNHNQQTFEQNLLNLLGEDNVLLTQFFSWAPSAKIFSDVNYKVWTSIKNVIEKAKTLLITRQYFEKKWLLNSINFIKYSQNYIKLQNKIKKPVLILSSGPSLKSVLTELHNIRSKFFIICLSSAISVCLNNNITPDLCLTTDGGYWAGQHLKKLVKKDIPLACPAEAYIPKRILSNNTILPLDYGDGISNTVLSLSGINSISAKRNGTVSGTALELALAISDSDIYFSGLDLSPQNGYQHTQPNELELNNSLTDNRLFSKEKRLYPGSLPSYSLNLYLEWFNSYNCRNRNIFRIIDSEYVKNHINLIKDISSKEFFDSTTKIKEIDVNISYFSLSQNEKNISNIRKHIDRHFDDDKILNQLYPLDFILYKHEENDELLNKIKNKHSELKHKLSGILNG